MSAIATWRRGMACVYAGDWPGYVRSIDEQRGRAVVRFLGSGPDRLGQEWTVSVESLARPPGWRHLDSRATRHWTTKKPWTADDLRLLRREWNRRSHSEVAVLVGRSEAACKIAMGRWWGGVKRNRDGRVMSLEAVARLLAVDPHRVEMLVERGWLRAARAGVRAGMNERWSVSEADLGYFLEHHPEHYDWRRMQPGPLRAFAEAVDARDPLLTIDQVAERVCLDRKRVCMHVAAGRLPGVWSSGGRAGSARQWLVHASACAAFVVKSPGEILGERIARLVRSRGLMTVAEAARRMNAGRSDVGKYIHSCGLPAEKVRVGRRWVWGVRPWPVYSTRACLAELEARAAAEPRQLILEEMA
jgi:hypothetical protein